MRVQDDLSSSKPAKRPRKARTRRKLKALTFPLFQLPTELVSYILDFVTEADELEALLWSCRTFYRACRRRALLARFPAEVAWCLNVYCLEGAREGEFGWKPFSISHCTKPDEGKDVLIQAAEHDVTRLQDGDTLAYLKIQWTEGEVHVRDDCACEVCWSDPVAKSLSWRWEVRGRLLKMTSSAMRARFGCPECMNTRTVLLGSEDLDNRWPDLEAGLYRPFERSCPRCTISHEEIAALHHHAIHVCRDDLYAFNYYFLGRSPSPSYPNVDYPDAPSSSIESTPCSSVDSSVSDEQEYPPRIVHGDSDEENNLPLQFFDGDGDADLSLSTSPPPPTATSPKPSQPNTPLSKTTTSTTIPLPTSSRP